MRERDPHESMTPNTRDFYVERIEASRAGGKKIIAPVEKSHPDLADDIYEVTREQQELIDAALVVDTPGEFSAFVDRLLALVVHCALIARQFTCPPRQVRRRSAS